MNWLDSNDFRKGTADQLDRRWAELQAADQNPFMVFNEGVAEPVTVGKSCYCNQITGKKEIVP